MKCFLRVKEGLLRNYNITSKKIEFPTQKFGFLAN